MTAGLAGTLFFSGCGEQKATSAAASSAASEQVFNVGTRGTSKPYTYVDDNGKLTGYDIEILREIEKRNPGIHFEFKPMALNAAYVAMDAGQIDLIANQMTKTPAREEKYIFPKELNNYSVRKLVVKEGRTDIHSLDDLKGKTVAISSPSEFHILVDEFNQTADPKINIVYVDKGPAETLNLVATGRVDAAGEYEYITKIAREDRHLPVEPVGPVLKVIPTYFLLKKGPQYQKLADTIDKTLKEMKADGTLKKLSEKFLMGDYTVEPKNS